MTWGDDAMAELKRLRELRHSASRIALQLKKLFGPCTRNSVLGKLWRLGLANPKPEVSMTKPKPRHRPPPRTPPAVALRVGDRGWQAGPKLAPVAELPAPEDDSAIPIEQRRTLLELTNWTCRWPCGSPRDADFFYCGALEADFTANRPYCAAHAARAFAGTGRRD
jgi:GcrA cell cycle regulator